MDEIVQVIQALKTITEKGLENDKSILEVVKLLTSRFLELETRVKQAEDTIDLLRDRTDMLLTMYQTHFISKDMN